MAQEAEHVLGKDEDTGSNPVSSSRKFPMDSVPWGFFVFQIFYPVRTIYLNAKNQT